MDNPSNNSVDNTHAHLYKYKENHKLSQHDRRVKVLEERKEKRHQQTDNNRQKYDLFLREIEDIIDDEEMAYECSEMENHKNPKYHFKLMMTEWFVDIPDDLEENWLVKQTPEGFRILLITRNHNTYFYNKRGRFLFRTKTNFPGGGGTNVTGTTVLDCIYNKTHNSIFILDCLFWTAMHTLDSDSTFRFYWLSTKFQEMPELTQSLNLKYTFILIDSFPAERTLIQDKMFEPLKIKEHEILYDGVVFYHKESQYTFGYTPLATWLFSYMLPEKLGIDVPEIYITKMPEGYINLQHYIENKSQFTSMKKRHGRKREGKDDMETI